MAKAPSVKAALATLCLVLLGAYLGGAAAWPPPAPPALALGGLAIYLQLLAVPQCGFGFFSSAFAPLFAMVLLPGVGAGWALVAALLGLALRTAARGHASPAVRWREALADGLPTLAALAAAWACHGAVSPMASVAVGLAVYLPLCLWVPERLALESPGVQVELWYSLREMTGYHSFAVAFLGPVTAGLLQAGPWWTAVWLLPIFLALHRASRTDLLRLEEIERELLEQQARRSQRALQTATAQLAQTAQALQTQTSSRQLAQQLTQRLADCTTPVEVVQLLLDCLQAVVPARSQIFYAGGEQPLAWHSPHGPRLEGLVLQGECEPVARTAWQTGQMQSGSGASRVCPDENITLAVPVPGEGVLYLGRGQNPWQPLELELAQVVASQGALALQSVHRFANQQQALELHRQAHQRLELWVKRLDYLLEAARVLGSTQEEGALLDRFQQLLGGLIPHQRGAILDRQGLRLSWPEALAVGPALIALAEAVQQPLLLENFAQSRLAPPWAEAVSLLGVALSDEDGRWGVLLVSSAQPAAFDREQLDLLGLVGAQLTSALRGAGLRDQVRESQARLAQSGKMAAVGQLAAGIAHEINTPLAAVVLQLDSALMRLEQRPELVRSKLEMALKAIHKMQSIISKLLYYSRDAAVGRQPVDLNQLVQDTLELVAGQVQNDGIEIEVCSGEVPSLLANANELQQVLTKLLLNARDASLQAGSRQIRLETGGGQEAWMAVEDQGPGIDPAIRDRIFDPFFTTKDVGHGTGLGLSVSRDIVQNHGGRIEVDSRPGRTRFEVRLPLPELQE